MIQTDYFWTDTSQTTDRLQSTWVLYDGTPYYVSSVTAGDDGVPRLSIIQGGAGESVRPVTKIANSPKFNKFRTLPSLGWMVNIGVTEETNPVCSLFYLERNVIRSMKHGLNSRNVNIYRWNQDNDNLSVELKNTEFLQSLFYNPGILTLQRGDYPSFNTLTQELLPGSAFPFDREYMLNYSTTGIKEIWKSLGKVGIVVQGSIYLFRSKHYLREELSEITRIDINEIKEL